MKSNTNSANNQLQKIKQEKRIKVHNNGTKRFSELNSMKYIVHNLKKSDSGAFEKRSEWQENVKIESFFYSF